ncbi:unnamed protein product, partial [Sphagnum balticum]
EGGRGGGGGGRQDAPCKRSSSMDGGVSVQLVTEEEEEEDMMEEEEEEEEASTSPVQIIQGGGENHHHYHPDQKTTSPQCCSTCKNNNAGSLSSSLMKICSHSAAGTAELIRCKSTVIDQDEIHAKNSMCSQEEEEEQKKNSMSHLCQLYKRGELGFGRGPLGAGSIMQQQQQSHNNNNKQLNSITMDHENHHASSFSYTLRRNPKRSRRFIDQDYAVEVSAAAAPAKKMNSDSESETESRRGSRKASDNESMQGVGPRMKYECTTCKRIFKSHQALGGHRASHKKPCHYLAVAKDDNEEMFSIARKSKGHECSICHRVFNSGQALGGHKRCHWGHHQVSNPKREVLERELDLNMPAPESDDFEGSRVFEEP